MQVIGVLNTKGGTGKTTLATCLSVEASKRGRVAVCDLDPQGSFTDWHGRRGNPDNPSLMRGVDLASDAVERLNMTSAYDYLFLDGPPGALMVTEDAIKTCQLVLVPIRASGLDLGASQDAIALCQEIGTRFLVVINAKTQYDAKLVEKAREVLNAWKVPVAKTEIPHRVPFVNAITSGRTGPEKDKRAADEIEELWKECLAAMRKTAKGRAA